MRNCQRSGYARYTWNYLDSDILLPGHRPVIVKRAVIGSKGGWKLSIIFLSCTCKVFHDWSIIKLGKILYLLDGYIFAVLFETTSNYFC